MPSYSVNSNFKEVQRNFGRLQKAMDTDITQAGLSAAANVVASKAREPRFGFNDRTGSLRRSIRVQENRRDNGGRPGVLIGSVRANYGFLIENGSVNQKARAPLRRAREETIPDALNSTRTAMVREFVKVARRLDSRSRRF